MVVTDMPWTGQSFKSRHWKKAGKGQAAHASRMANAMLRSGASEGIAIATAIKRSKGKRRRKRVNPAEAVGRK